MYNRRKDKTIAKAEVYLHHVGCEIGRRFDALTSAINNAKLSDEDITDRIYNKVMSKSAACCEMTAAPIEDLMLSVRAYNVLKRAGIDTVIEIIHYTEDELAELRNMNKKALLEIKYTLGLFGLHLSEPCEWDGVEEDWAGELDMEFLEEFSRAVI